MEMAKFLTLLVTVVQDVLHPRLLQDTTIDYDTYNDTFDQESIDELQGKCSSQYFGYKCKFKCHCQRDEPCDKLDGTCYSGCADDYWGPGCQLSKNCYYNGNIKQYMGKKSVTANLYTCKKWEDQDIYKPEHFADKVYPENYCRVTHDSKKNWCYTTDRKMRWDYCNVKDCKCIAGRFGNNCEKECHCKDPDEVCNSILGHCTSGCALGWTNPDCQKEEACPANTYGWDCSQKCYCRDPSNCHRLRGPLPSCECKEGYFNRPNCQRVTKPRIVDFKNKRVNPGEYTVFNCTISAFPTPRRNDITLRSSVKKQITLSESHELKTFKNSRANIFKVNSVAKNEKYTCYMDGESGKTSLTIPVDLYEPPVLRSKPVVPRNKISATNMTIEWTPWNQRNGDIGDPPILWYTIWVKTAAETNFRMMGLIYHTFCREKRVCSHIIQELRPSTRYKIYIVTRRDGDGGSGPPGPSIFAKTLCSKPDLPPKVGQLLSAPQYNISYPKTKITITWTDPPIGSWNCDSITIYLIRFTSLKYGIAPRVIKREGNTAKFLTIQDLEPATTYCVDLMFHTNKGFISPYSDRKCVTTPETKPPPPKNLMLKKRLSTSVVVSWEQPDNPRGNITKYRIMYWGISSTAIGLEVKSSRYYNEYTITGLKPYTIYKLQVRSINGAGIGQSGEVLSFTTDQSLPGPVGMFKNISRTFNSITLQWSEPPHPNGNILFFMLSCHSADSMMKNKPYSGGVFKIPSKVFTQTVENLHPATEYDCSINASTSKGSGQRRQLIVWTKGKAPLTPHNPKIINHSDNSVTVELKPRYDKDISFYRLIVERITNDHGRKKRSLPAKIADVTADYYSALNSNDNCYVTAQFPPSNVRSPFMIGDNLTYSNYFNGPLQPDYAYNIWFGAFSTVDGAIQKSFAKTSAPLNMRRVDSVSPSSHISVIIGVIVVFVFLIITFAILLMIWRRKHLTAEREKADMPSFGPTILPEPDTSPPSTPIGKNVQAIFSKAAVTTDTNEPVYGNLGVTIPSVKVEDLWDYIKRNKENDMEGLKNEYKLTPAGLTAKCDVAKKTENKMKNRYGNIVAYDHTRVKLNIEDDPHDDYINANYIDGYEKEKAYIAAQGPNRSTLNDIWRMVWQENSKTIIMLTNPTETGKRKCDQYWPDEGTQVSSGISIECLNVDKLPDFTIRTFLLQMNGVSKIVKQFHYTTWPDHGVPKFGNSLILFRQKIRAFDRLDNGPVIVHCSAGVGRTGTYIAIDAQLEQAREEGIVDVHNFVQHMRRQRVNMVQTLEQYVFVYDVLLEALLCGDTTICCDSFPSFYASLCEFDPSIGKSKLEEQFEILRLISATMDRDESTSALRPENIFKNRCKNITPANRCRPYLTTPADESNDYINAVFLNSYKKRDAFIVTQMTLPNTVVDFWRLIYDHNSSTIVMLNEIDEKDESCEMYWTLDTCGENYGPFIVETTAEIKSHPSITVRDFTITNTRNPQEAPRIVRQFHFHRWSEGDNFPNSKLALVELLDMVEKWQHETGDSLPVTVHCMNGASRSGLYCAISCVLERINAEKEVDVFQAVKQLRLNRSQLVDNYEQFRFCHEVALEYIQDCYPNYT
ncbi:receptor-type tyrosine-protein phosphatase T isoform X3 [Octopus bimaculoides]|uniref:receptor-type tyrosine-protein phosphatase T isoform X3 n=1 Tax=Octopus bimaculoides TaxID=37653 RepID=UPI00071E5DF1|nr:receptor-type tyrosine-protein phosphatase T isoform X3 [Octopus bimaculoides]|eukprot:XP_014783728.1 PREDICTED: receptor-type tyrosine-protein phosphatase T-like isoform X3 [Octopus bimaculoides]